MAKPIVDGIEQEIAGDGQVLRIDVKSELGQQLARRYQISGLPTVLVLDGKGNLVLYQNGPPGKETILDAVIKARRQ